MLLHISLGLSPRVRGNLLFADVQAAEFRSIPACAGEPADRVPKGGPVPVYPRVCGGTRRIVSVPVSPAGLSPRVRGNRRAQVLASQVCRSIPACAGEPNARFIINVAGGSIPACAGEPPACSSTLCVSRVYPRVCGGTVLAGCTACSRVGLSPRVRGNLRRQAAGLTSSGSIPACAGEPPGAGGVEGVRPVYPRVCGGTLLPCHSVGNP